MSPNNQPHCTATERRYTPQELATLWQCSTCTVYELLRQGKLKGFKLGRDWRIPESAIRDYEQAPENQAAKVYNRNGQYARQPTPAVMRVVYNG